MDFSALQSEIVSDPQSIGYAALVATGSDQAIANLLNASDRGTVTLAVMSRDDFLVAMVGPALALSTKDDATQKKWDRMLAIARSADLIKLPVVSGLLAAMVADGLLSQDDADAVGKVPGSRAEVLFGAGIRVSANDVSDALRELR